MKNVIKQAKFLIGPCLICYFVVILFYIEKKWLLLRTLALVLPLKSILSGKFYRFNAINGSIKMLKNKWIFKKIIKMKNCKTFYEPPKFRNSIVEWVIFFFVSFCWHWVFLLENLKIKKPLWWCPLEHVDEFKNVVCPKQYFQKRKLQISFFGLI